MFERPWYRIPHGTVLKHHQMRATIDKLIAEGGVMNHSALSATLHVVIHRLEEAKVPFTLRAMPGFGYSVEVAAPSARPDLSFDNAKEEKHRA